MVENIKQWVVTIAGGGTGAISQGFHKKKILKIFLGGGGHLFCKVKKYFAVIITLKNIFT